MIKIDIVKKVAQHLKLKDGESLAVVDAIIECLKETISDQGRLEIRDFGVFQIKERKPRIGRNPRNLKEYPIPPRRVVTFKLGKDLRDFSASKSGPSRLLKDNRPGHSEGAPSEAKREPQSAGGEQSAEGEN